MFLDCQGMLARVLTCLERARDYKKMFKKRRGYIIHTRHIDENEESIIYNGDQRGAWWKTFLRMQFYRWKRLANIFQSEKLKAFLRLSGRWSGDYRTERGTFAYFLLLSLPDRGYKKIWLILMQREALMTATLMKCQSTLLTSCVLDWSGQVGSYTSMSSKKAVNLMKQAVNCLFFLKKW